jgi:HEAT repeat protein
VKSRTAAPIFLSLLLLLPIFPARTLSAEDSGDKETQARVAELIERIRVSDRYGRGVALEAIVAVGRPAVPLLLRLLEDPKATSRSCAAYALGRIGDPSAADPLFKALSRKDNDVSARFYLAEGLAGLGDPRAVAPLAGLLRDEDLRWDVYAARALGRMGKEAVKTLVGLARDLNPNVRQMAGFGIAELSCPEAAPGVVALLKDGYPGQIMQVLIAVKRIGAPAEKPLRTLLSDPKALVRQRAAIGLGSLGKADVVDQLLAAFEGTDDETSSLALDALVCVGPEAAKALWKKVETGSGRARAWAIVTLGRMRDPRTLDPLIEVFSGKDRTLRYHAGEALKRLGRPAIPKLRELEKHDDAGVRRDATLLLGRMGFRSSIARLVEMIRTGSPPEKHSAAYALSRLGRAAVEPLLPLLEEKDRYVREKACMALGYIGRASVVPLLRVLESPNPAARACAAKVLGKLRDRRAVEPLLKALGDPVESVRRQVGEALTAFGGSLTDRLLRALEEKNPLTRRTAACVLAELGDPRAAGPLLHALKDADPEVKGWALAGLGKLRLRKAVPAIIEALADKDASVRRAALGALGALGDARAAGPLARLLGDPSLRIRREAADALARLGSPALPHVVPLLDDPSLKRGPWRYAFWAPWEIRKPSRP